MKIFLSCAAALALAVGANAQSGPPAKDADLTGLTTPVTLDPSKLELGLQFTGFGASDSLLRTGVSAKYGLAKNWEIRLGGTFAAFDSANQGGGQIGFGGSDSNVILKYCLPGSIQSSVEAGLGFADTPAQERRTISLLGASAGYSLSKDLRVYVNPKFVALQDNNLFAVSVGAVADVMPGISVYGVWTPLFDGDNYVSQIDGTASRQQLYAVGLRFANVCSGLSVDVAFTNMIGQTYGFSLTPSYGNTGGLYVGLNYRL